jgi:hypothetical protein
VRYVWFIFLGLTLGCSPKKEQASPPKKTGLRLAKAKREPKDLAQEFQQTLAHNDAEEMMMLSILGHGLNNWKIIAQARNARALQTYEAELAAVEKKPREDRTEKEQARYFTLHSLIGKIKQSNTDEFWQAQETELPNLRRQFMEQQYLQFVLALTEAGLNPEEAKLGKIDTSRITNDYLQAGLNGGTVVLHYQAADKDLETGVAFECVKFQDEGWLIVGQPKVIRHTAIGPKPETPAASLDPFSVPASE